MLTIKEAEKTANDYGYRLTRKIPKRNHCLCGGKQVGIIRTHYYINYNDEHRIYGWKCFCRKCGVEGTPDKTQMAATENWNKEIKYGWEV